MSRNARAYSAICSLSVYSWTRARAPAPLAKPLSACLDSYFIYVHTESTHCSTYWFYFAITCCSFAFHFVIYYTHSICEFAVSILFFISDGLHWHSELPACVCVCVRALVHVCPSTYARGRCFDNCSILFRSYCDLAWTLPVLLFSLQKRWNDRASAERIHCLSAKIGLSE